MSEMDLFPVGLSGFRVVSLRADQPHDDDDERVTYRVGILRHEEHVRLIGILTVMGEKARGLVVVEGDAVWRNTDFDKSIIDMSDDECIATVKGSYAVHNLYDAAALALRQSFGLLGRNQTVAELTPEPIVDFILPDDEETDESSESAASVAG
jgi:hypothetical protein